MTLAGLCSSWGCHTGSNGAKACNIFLDGLFIFRSAQLSQIARACTTRSCEEALRCKGPFKTCARNKIVPKLSSLPCLSCQHTHPFSTDMMVTFQRRSYVFHTPYERIMALFYALNISIYGTFERALFLKSVVLHFWCMGVFVSFREITVCIGTFFLGSVGSCFRTNGS